MIYKVKGNYVEYLEEKEIEAETEEEAYDKYTELWEAGMLLPVDSMLAVDSNFEIEIEKEEEIEE
jgi:hypothetical protein